jgi:uncharacterized protein
MDSDIGDWWRKRSLDRMTPEEFEAVFQVVDKVDVAV